jgi:hypothetical protein
LSGWHAQERRIKTPAIITSKPKKAIRCFKNQPGILIKMIIKIASTSFQSNPYPPNNPIITLIASRRKKSPNMADKTTSR